MYNIGIIGAGKVGVSLERSLYEFSLLEIAKEVGISSLFSRELFLSFIISRVFSTLFSSTSFKNITFPSLVLWF